jgi:acetate kinase
VVFAPLHQPACLAGIRAAARTWPDRPQVACFDTAFHHTLEPTAFTYALPAGARADGVRRYGFHGLSYEYLVDHLGAAATGRVVMAHLGAGASLCAAVDGRSVDTTMGFTPAGGLVMVSRPGDLDPGVLIHLLRHGADRSAGPGAHPIGADELEDLVNHRSGLAGLGGHQGDARALLAARAAGDADATLALAVFTRTAAKQVAGMAAAMGGIDALVFTAGIGQHAPDLRAEICQPLAFLGVSLDGAANRRAAAVISDGPVTVRVVPTDEERMIARHAAAAVVRG